MQGCRKQTKTMWQIVNGWVGSSLLDWHPNIVHISCEFVRYALLLAVQDGKLES